MNKKTELIKEKRNIFAFSENYNVKDNSSAGMQEISASNNSHLLVDEDISLKIEDLSRRLTDVYIKLRQAARPSNIHL